MVMAQVGHCVTAVLRVLCTLEVVIMARIKALLRNWLNLMAEAEQEIQRRETEEYFARLGVHVDVTKPGAVLRDSYLDV